MKTQKWSRPRREHGYSLAEVMVAMAILTVVILAALTIYDRSNRMFNQGVQASDMQQSTRVAFDKLVSDIRLAGFDYDRDGIPFGAMAPTWTPSTSYVMGNLMQPNPANGHTYVCTSGGTSGATQPSWPTGSKATQTDGGVTWQEQGILQYQQPDEQIEYAGESAVTIRANFNYTTASGACAASGTPVPCENGREVALESTQFPLVTTGNDEIVTYALVSNSGNSAANQNSVVFYADTAVPRNVNPSTNSKENKVTISGVDTTNLYPPYTLYRYTLNSSGTPVGTPIADNIRRMTLRYYTDTAGTAEITVLPYGAGQYDAANQSTVIPERDTRATILAVRVELVGMNPNIDPAYTDADTAAPHYRKYELDSLVVPRNIGKHGMKEFSTLPPAAPKIKAVCTASCNAVYVTWEGPSSGGDVDSYNLLYDVGDCGGSSSCDGCNVSYAIAEDAGSNLSGYASKITPGQKYRFGVQSINKFGAATSTNCISATVLNSTTPADPTVLDASGGGTGTYPAVATGIQLYWPPVTMHNSSKNSTSCSDGTTKAETKVPSGENIRYRIYRSKYDDNLGSIVLMETTATQPTAAGNLLTWTDKTYPMGSCIDYYYRIQAVSYPCCTSDSMNTSSKSQAISSVYPDPSSQKGIKGRANTTAKPAVPDGVGISTAVAGCTGTCNVKVNWNKVATDTGGNPMFVDGYVANLYKQDAMGNWVLVDKNYTYNGSSTTTFYSLDDTSYYKVAVQAVDCLTSDESQPAYWPCNWSGGTISIAPGTTFGGTGSSSNPWIIQSPGHIVVTTGSNIQKVDLAVFNGAAQVGATMTINGPASTFNFTLPTTPDNAKCKVHITMTALAPSTCVINQDYYVIDNSAPSCSLVDVATDATVMSWTSPNNYVDITLKNTSANVLVPRKIYLVWDTSNSGPAKFATGVSSVMFDQNGASPKEGLAATCSSANVGADVSAVSPDPIAASSSNYVVRVVFAMQSGKALLGNPITKVNVQYQVPFGDIKNCQIVPNPLDPGPTATSSCY